MFQNIDESTINIKENQNEKNKKIKTNIFADVFALKNIPIYIMTLMLSMVGITGDFSPFSISIFGACLANSVPALGIIFFKFDSAGSMNRILQNIDNHIRILLK